MKSIDKNEYQYIYTLWTYRHSLLNSIALFLQEREVRYQDEYKKIKIKREKKLEKM